MKYLIFGAGYMARMFAEGLDDACISNVRVRDSSDSLNEIVRANPEWVINCAGIVGRPNVDWCESHRMETFMGNVILPLDIAKACRETGTPLLHIGSGCVYSGDKGGIGFSEDDPPNFAGSFYSKSKAMAEDLLKDFDTLQLRIRMPVDCDLGCSRNLIHKLVGYNRVINVKNSITIAEDAVYAAEQLMKSDYRGIYNTVNPGPMTHKEILELYREIINPSFEYELISVEELAKDLAAERSNCVLNTQKLSKIVKLQPLETRLQEIFMDYLQKTSEDVT
ncbi:MAG: sugar nucleotide-binding protein [Candidatus Altiarchaeota archaeon]|nr:sugar nucleotide-binding protein [Candidatus Altiarchaeota archaeon]